MDKRRTRIFRDKLLDRREGLVGQVQAAELYSRERDAEATQDPADMAANAYTKELLVSMSDNDRQLLNLIDEALERIFRVQQPTPRAQCHGSSDLSLVKATVVVPEDSPLFPIRSPERTNSGVEFQDASSRWRRGASSPRLATEPRSNSIVQPQSQFSRRADSHRRHARKKLDLHQE